MTTSTITDCYPDEQWKPIKDYEGLYEVSDYGRVRSLEREVTQRYGGTQTKRAMIRKQSLNTRGYPQISLTKNNKDKLFLVHRLVAAAFIGECPKGYWVNHKDGNKLNNDLNNLEYMTPRDNNMHAKDTGLNKARGETHMNAQLSNKDVYHILGLLQDGISTSEIAARFNVSPAVIFNIKTNRSWKHIPRPML